MVYTGNWLAGGCPETKTGGRYDDYDGVAIECQNYPDAVNHPDFPSPLLRPGELYCQKIVFRFGTLCCPGKAKIPVSGRTASHGLVRLRCGLVRRRYAVCVAAYGSDSIPYHNNQNWIC